MATLHLGYFDDFKGDDTLLMAGGVAALEELRALFRSLVAGRIRSLEIHRLPFIQAHHGVELTATCVGHDRGTRRCGSGNSFLWERSESGWVDTVDKLDVLVSSGRPCHHFLETEEDDVVVMVSRDEYKSERWWAEHG